MLENWKKSESLIIDMINLNFNKVEDQQIANLLATCYKAATENDLETLLRAQYALHLTIKSNMRETFEKQQMLALNTELKLQIR